MKKIIASLLIMFFCVSCNDSQHTTEKEGYRIYRFGSSGTMLLDTETGETWILDEGNEIEYGWHPVEFLEYSSQKDFKDKKNVFSGKTPWGAQRNKRAYEKDRALNQTKND